MIRSDTEKVDLIIPTVEYQELALERGLARHVLTIEDVIVQKVLAWRVKDRGDLRAVLAADHAIDETYIEHCTDEFDVADRWVEAKTWR